MGLEPRFFSKIRSSVSTTLSWQLQKFQKAVPNECVCVCLCGCTFFVDVFLRGRVCVPCVCVHVCVCVCTCVCVCVAGGSGIREQQLEGIESNSFGGSVGTCPCIHATHRSQSRVQISPVDSSPTFNDGRDWFS